MSFNIVDLIKDQISDQVLGQLSGVLGTGTDNTSGAIAGAVPSLLSGLTNAASSPSGAGALFNAVQDQDDGLLGNIGNLLGGDQASNIASNGTSLLTSLIGGGALGQLSSVIASVAGVGSGKSNSLIGMLAPIIMGVLKNKVLGGGLNAGSLSSLLTQQKDNVSAAMPQAFSSQLQSAGFFDSIAPQALSALGNTGQTVAGAAQNATDSAASMASSGVSAVKDTASATAANTTSTFSGDKNSGGGFMKWLLPLIAIAGIGWFGLQYMNKQSSEKLAAEKEAATQAAAEKADAMKLEAEAAAQGSASESLSGITDLESAKNAVPALQEAASNLGGLNDVMARLPEAAKGPLGSIVQGGIGTLQPLIEKVSAIPGVGAVIGPVIAPIMEMLNGMAG